MGILTIFSLAKRTNKLKQNKQIVVEIKIEKCIITVFVQIQNKLCGKAELKRRFVCFESSLFNISLLRLT